MFLTAILRRKTWCFIFLILFAGGYQNFAQDPAMQVVKGVVLKTNIQNLDAQTFFSQLRNRWGIAVDSFTAKEKTIVFSVEGALVVLTSQDYPVPLLEWAAPAGISWLWRNARSELMQHRTQVLISVAGNHGQSLHLYQIFTKIAGAVLECCASLGVFMPNQYLLVPKNFYLESARNVMEGELPLYLWVYFGSLEEHGLASCYTFGMSEFGLKEMEIVRTPRTIALTHAILYDAARQTILSGRRLRTGDEISIQNEETVTCQVSKGALLDEVETVKILLK